jgi:hypothetical protein
MRPTRLDATPAVKPIEVAPNLKVLTRRLGVGVAGGGLTLIAMAIGA